VPNESQLSDVLSEFARTMVTDFPIQDILDHLVKRIVDIMPITEAGVTLISPGIEPRYVAASSAAALQFEKLQSELDEGPCLVAYASGKAVSVPDMSREKRFPRFVAGATEIGLVAVFTFPLTHGERRIGALDLYRDSAGELSPKAMTAAQTLADVVTAYIVNAQGRADLKEASHRSRELALHDALTGLPNRVLLLERIDHSLRRGRRSHLTTALFFVDVDRFKKINDSFGHRVGDEVLMAVAERLSEVLRPGDTLARISGDEFVALCEDLDGAGDANSVVRRLNSALERPFVIAGIEMTISASVGTAMAAPGTGSAEDLLHAADTAMYQAKRAGAGHHQVLDLSDPDIVVYQADLERDMHGLVARGELRLDYQPIVASTDGHMSGVEALLRWAHPSLGLVSPNVLIPLAERAGLIPAIGQWVLDTATAEQGHWQNDYRVHDLAISVNVSAHQLMSAGFVQTVAAALEQNLCSTDRLILEITESVFVSDAPRALMVLNDLKALGVKLALDDFGTGYSSLSYLLEFPVDIVKIDQIFVAGLGQNGANQSIVSAIIQLAHGLGLTVVAEGVETVEQYRALLELGSDSCQGFYFARPMSGGNIDALIERRVDGSNQILPEPARVTTGR
jgi:diguanylate cyclase (GGDEF)-like protein